MNTKEEYTPIYKGKPSLEWLIEKYPDKDWRWERLVANPNLVLDVMEEYPSKKWKWKNVSDMICIYKHNEYYYKKSLQSDIEKRRETIERLLHNHKKLYTDLVATLTDYVGYN